MGTRALRASRYLYVALAWAVVGAILLQVLFIGLGLFANAENLTLHANFGWILHLAPLVVLVAAAVAGAGQARVLFATATAVIVWFVPIVAVLRSSAPVVAAFHPVIAMVGFWLAIVVARGATDLSGGTDPHATTLRQWLLVAVVVVIFLFLSFSGSPEPT